VSQVTSCSSSSIPKPLEPVPPIACVKSRSKLKVAIRSTNFSIQALPWLFAMSVVWNVYQYFQNKTLKSDFNLAMKMCAAFHQGLWLFLKWPADKEEEDELVTICGPIIDHLDESGY
jgi:hypothetical protein